MIKIKVKNKKSIFLFITLIVVIGTSSLTIKLLSLRNIIDESKTNLVLTESTQKKLNQPIAQSTEENRTTMRSSSDSQLTTILEEQVDEFEAKIENDNLLDEPTKHSPDDFNVKRSAILGMSDYEQVKYQASFIPNDYRSSTYYINNMSLTDTWDVSTGSNNVVVAVIDTGFGLNHEEFANRWYLNSGEVGTTTNTDRCWNGIAQNKSTNACDDDNNGYVDDYRGWDFVFNDNQPQSGTTIPNTSINSHGLMVAGVLAATGNNLVGIAGVDWQTKIMPLQVLDDSGSGETNSVVAAIEYAIKNGADVINMSFGSPDYDVALDLAVKYAESKGVVMVASAGNCGASASGNCAGYSTTGRMSYPARHSTVLSVGATDINNSRGSFSSYGADLDVVAPGVALGPVPYWTASNPTSAYIGSVSGTSFSSPLVAGVVSLMLSIDPNMQPDFIREILKNSANRVSGMSNANWTQEYGFGVVNAYNAVRLSTQGDIASSYNDVERLDGNYIQPSVNYVSYDNTQNPISGRAVMLNCLNPIESICNLRLQKIGQSTVRYLPSKKTDQNGLASWWVNDLTAGSWQITAHNSEHSSEILTIVIP